MPAESWARRQLGTDAMMGSWLCMLASVVFLAYSVYYCALCYMRLIGPITATARARNPPPTRRGEGGIKGSRRGRGRDAAATPWR